MRALIAIAVLALAGCANTHNDQRNCTTNCNIGSTPVYAPPVVTAPVVVHPAPVIHHHWTPQYWHRYGRHRGTTVIIR